MLLAIDIGNTNISFGVFQGLKLIRRFDIPTPGYSLKRIRAGLGKIRVSRAIICSVVPCVTKILTKDIKRLCQRQPYIIGKNIFVPLKNLYYKPKQVGQDRLVNAYAGVRLYGAPLIVVDFGTAVTFDVVSQRAGYLGGMILPGLGISLDALYQKTALLPKIKLARPKEFIGRDTKSSILSGIVYGFASLTDDLAIRIQKRMGCKAQVVGTGGNVTLISRYCRRLTKIDKNLTLRGLNLIYRHKQG